MQLDSLDNAISGPSVAIAIRGYVITAADRHIAAVIRLVVGPSGPFLTFHLSVYVFLVPRLRVVEPIGFVRSRALTL